VAAAYHRARRAEGLLAWIAPQIHDWNSFVRAAWESRTQSPDSSRLVLNSTQEQALWAELAREGRHLATILEGPRHRLGALAMDAHELLCTHAPHYLEKTARSAWQQDAAAFSQWLARFDEACGEANAVSAARLPLELLPLLEADTAARSPLLLAGFDRILPAQRRLLDAWGQWMEAARGEPAAQGRFYTADSAQAELAACALWARHRLAADPLARLLVVTQDARGNRGEIERAFLQHVPNPTGDTFFEFSLGVPLNKVALARGAFLLLRWLGGPLAEHEVDFLFFTGQTAAIAQETAALQAHMRTLRQRGQQQPEWSVAAFLGQGSNALPASWVARIVQAQRRLAEAARESQSPLNWAELVPQLLEVAGWPGFRPLSSAEHQARRRWLQALETAASLGFDGRYVDWKDFLSLLARTLDETLYAPESRDAPIQIAGPAESAGLTADAIWFLGADETAWPPSGPTHSLLPLDVQRQAEMPHGTSQFDWDLAHAVSMRLLASAPEVCFSYARQKQGTDIRPSRLIVQLAGPPQPLPADLLASSPVSPMTAVFQDASRIPFVPGKVAGGAAVLTAQSQCPFKAFAGARLGAKAWEPAEAGLTPSQRGQLLHAVMHAVWGGPPEGIRTQSELLSRRPDLPRLVHRVLEREIGSALRERMPRRYLELEEQRLTRLVSEWLDYEATRAAFEVTETEAGRTIHLAGLTFNLRLDRIDLLNDDSLLVIDYKTGEVQPKTWDLPRPDDVQLPLYAGFALNPETEPLGGLVFAKVRAGDQCFAGRVGQAVSTLLPALKGTSPLVKNPLSAEQIIDWKQYIEQLARDFTAGRAEVDPREAPKTCARCGLQTLCRIHQNESQCDVEVGLDGDAGADHE